MNQTNETIILLPYPQKLTRASGDYVLSDAMVIALDVPEPAGLFFTASRLKDALSRHAGITWDLVGGAAVPDDQIGLVIRLDASVENSQGYRLVTGEQPIHIEAKEPVGAFYGVLTLIQLLQQFGATLPKLTIDDWPDLPNRGLMLDISRDKVPTMETLYDIVDRLASWKINEFQLYTEHTFAFRNHPDASANASPMTAEQIMALDAYCRERFIDLVPNQASFGHMHRWFEHPQYMDMAESPDGFVTPWGVRHDIPFSLSPTSEKCLPFLEGLYNELLPNFSSRKFNVNLDETFDLGQGRSKAIVAEKGTGRVYLDFLLGIYERVKAQGKTMQFWGDIVAHYPELVPELPRDLIALDWWYDADYDFPTTAAYAKNGIPFYVCPGTSTWCSIAGRTDNAMANIDEGVEIAIKRGGIGLLNTDWGDGGHWQPLPTSFLGWAWGAALSWGYRQNVERLDVKRALDLFAFEDRAGVMGKLAYDLGNAYQQPGIYIRNGSALWWAYTWSLDGEGRYPATTMAGKVRSSLKDNPALADNLRKTIQYVDDVLAPLDQAQMDRPDAETIKDEFRVAGEMLKHGARRLLAMAGDPSVTEDGLAREFADLERRYRERWLTRNRPGGLDDSIKRMTGQRAIYE